MGDRERINIMAFPAKGGLRSYPMEGYPGRATTRTAMRVHFLHWHVLDTVIILEEGNPPHPRCAQCDRLFPRQALNGRQPDTAQCARGAERNWRRLTEAEMRDIFD